MDVLSRIVGSLLDFHPKRFSFRDSEAGEGHRACSLSAYLYFALYLLSLLEHLLGIFDVPNVLLAPLAFQFMFNSYTNPTRHVETEAWRADVHDRGHRAAAQQSWDLPTDSRCRTLVSDSPTSYPYTCLLYTSDAADDSIRV